MVGGLRIKSFVILLLAIILSLLILNPAYGLPQDIKKPINAGEILEKIKNGESVKYNNVSINGDLNLSNLDLSERRYKKYGVDEKRIKYLSEEKKIVESSIDIENSAIIGYIQFDNIIFNNSINFNDTVFSKDVFFRGTQFIDDSSFRNAKFSNNAYFEWAEFNGLADFQNAVFSMSTHFLEANFLGSTDFKKSSFNDFLDMRYAEFRGPTNFAGDDFGRDAYFERAHFSSDVDFRNSIFYGFAAFWWSIFDKSVDFRGSKFYRDAYFLNSQFKGESHFSDVLFHKFAEFRQSSFLEDAFFWNAIFEEKADFMEAKFEKNVDYEDAVFGLDASFDRSQFSSNRNCVASFQNTSFRGNVSFAKASLSPISNLRSSHFNGILNMTQAAFDRIDLKWENIKSNLICDESVYVSLINNFRILGRYHDADDCSYEYGIYRLRTSNFEWSWLIDVIAWITCGFGVRPLHTIVWCVSLIILFGIVYNRFSALRREDRKRHKPLFRSNNLRRRRRKTSYLDALYFSTMVFFVSLPPQDLRPEGQWRYVVLLEDILGWILMTLFVITLGHVMIR